MGILSGLFGEKVDYKELIKNGAVAVDVRTVEEFKSGHAECCTNVPLQTIGSKVESFKGKTVVVVCRSGARSAQAKRILESAGIKVYNAGPWHALR